MATTVAVSVLFTDLVGSTELSSSLGADAAERFRSEHLASLREVTERTGGRLIKNLGDGIMSVFSSVSASLDAAVQMQQAVERGARDGVPAAIRVGVSVGDCVEEDGDYFGEPVVQAARLCGVAEGGQILANAVVAALAQRGRHELVEAGTRELKGLPEPLPVVEVAWAPEPLAATIAVPLQDRVALPARTPFVGRGSEREVLAGALSAARAGECRVVLLSGEAGAGKTRLAIEVAREASAGGAMVLYGRCDAEVTVPYRPWVEVIDHYVRHASDAALVAVDRHHLVELARVVPALRGRPALDDAGEQEDSGDQYVLFGAVAGLLAGIAAAAPLVLVLDDLHWADRGTLQLLRHVVAALPAAPLLVIGTYRETEVDRDHPLTALVAALHREVLVAPLSLHGLSEDAVAALVDAELRARDPEGPTPSAADPGLARALLAETGGNPFFIGELLQHLVESGRVDRDELGGWRLTGDLGDTALPPTVREVVRARLRRLGDPAGEVLSAASVLGRDFELGLVAAMVGLDADDAFDLLEPAITAGLVAEVDGAAERLSFTHALVQHSVYQDLTAGRRARLHRTAAEVIRGVPEAPRRAGEVAHHLLQGLPPSQLAQVVPHAVAAAEHALTAAAPVEAVRWFRTAVDVAEGDPATSPGERGRLLVRLGEAEREAGLGEYRRRLLDAAQLARKLDDADLLVSAAIANNRGLAASETGAVDRERVAVIESALAVVDEADIAARALLLAGLAGELIFSGEERRFELARDAVDLARRTGDPRTLVVAIHRAATVLDLPRCFEQRHRWVEEAMELTEGAPDPVGRFLVLTVAVRDELTLGDTHTALRLVEEAAALAARLGRPTMTWHSTFLGSTLALARGELDEAEQLAEAALRVGWEAGHADAFQIYGGQLTQIRWHQGRTIELVDPLVQLVEEHPHMPVYAAALALLHTLNGETDAARAVLTGLVEDQAPFPEDWNWGITCALAAQTAHLLADHRASALLTEMLDPYRHLVIATGATCLPSVSHLLGVLALTLGRAEEAEAHLVDALERHERLGAPFYCALTMLSLARLLRRRRPERSGLLLDEVERLSARHGFDGLAQEAKAERDAG